MTQLVKDAQLKFIKGYTKEVEECYIVPTRWVAWGQTYCYAADGFITLWLVLSVVYDEYDMQVEFYEDLVKPGEFPSYPQEDDRWRVESTVIDTIDAVDTSTVCVDPSSYTPEEEQCRTYILVVEDHYGLDTDGVWNAGAYLIDPLVGAGMLRCLVNKNTAAGYFGISTYSTEGKQTSPYNVKYGWLMNFGTATPIAFGTLTGTTLFVNNNDVLDMHREQSVNASGDVDGAQIVWYVNGVEVDRVSILKTYSSRNMVVQGSLFVGNDQILDAEILPETNSISVVLSFGAYGQVTDSAPVAGVSFQFAEGDLEFSFVGSLSDQSGGPQWAIGLNNDSVLDLDIEAQNTAAGIPEDAMHGQLSDTVGSRNAYGSLEFAFDGDARDINFVGQLTHIYGGMGTVAWALCFPGETVDGMPEDAMTMGIYDQDYAIGQMEYSMDAMPIMWQAFSINPAAADASIPVPMPKVTGAILTGERQENFVWFPPPFLEADIINEHGDSPVPLPFIEAEFGRGRTLLGDPLVPGALTEGLILVGLFYDAELPVPMPQVEGEFMWNAELPVPAPVVEGILVTGRALLGDTPVPLAYVEGDILTGKGVFTGEAPVPMPGVPFEPNLFGLVPFPVPFVEAAFDVSFAVDEMFAYAINLATGATSKWTAYPVIGRVVRWQNRHFAIVGGNMVEITGTKDITSDIDSVLQTAPYTLADTGLKRPVGIYLGVRESDGAETYLVVDENRKTHVYKAVAAKRGYGGHNLRTKVGRGVRPFRYVAVGVQNVDGGELDIHTLELMLDDSVRKV